MAQQNNATNFYLQDANGRPQMIKVLTGDNSMQEIIGTLTSGQQIKLLKTVNGQTVAQTLPQAQVLKTQKIITTKNLPVGAMAHAVQKTSDGQMPKTIRLTQISRPDLKMIPTTQKITLPLQAPSRVMAAKGFHTSPPILDHSGNRKRMDSMDNADCVPEMKRRKMEKAEKGLRHFSMKVCEKVRKKKATTYNEVADELVTEYTTQNPEKYDQKNIRRRVYDALNVLMAMGIISKQKKDITWIGLPSNSVQECIQLEQERKKKLQSIAEKRKYLLELITNLISFKNLVERNRELENMYGRPPASSCIELPFIVVKTNKNTVIDCSISQDKMEYLFNFNDKFEIHDDSEVLKQMGMLMGLDDGTCDSRALEKLKNLVPSRLQEYVTQIANGELNKLGAGPSMLSDDCIDTSTLDEITSHQSSSPALDDYSDDDMDSDISDMCDA